MRRTSAVLPRKSHGTSKADTPLFQKTRLWPHAARAFFMSAGLWSQAACTSSTSGTKCFSRFSTPCLSVAVEDGQPEQAPFMLR